jgi:hypothetical protein
MTAKKDTKGIVIIDVKDFPKNCPECAFYAKARCIPQGEFSTTSISNRPTTCPLMTATAYGIYMAKGA